MTTAETSKRPMLLALGALLTLLALGAFLLAVLGAVGPYLLFMPDDIDPVDRPPKLGPILLFVGVAVAFAYGAWASIRAARRRNVPPAT